MIGFAEHIGAIVVAQGIKTPAELAAISGLGATAGQGYLLGRPSTRPEHWNARSPRLSATSCCGRFGHGRHEHRKSPATLSLLDRIQESIPRLFKICPSLPGERRAATKFRCKRSLRTLRHYWSGWADSHIGERVGNSLNWPIRRVYMVHTFRLGLARIATGWARIPHVFGGSQCLQELECSSSPTSGTVFPQVRGRLSSYC
jgi:hypothetical protein